MNLQNFYLQNKKNKKKLKENDEKQKDKLVNREKQWSNLEINLNNCVQ